MRFSYTAIAIVLSATMALGQTITLDKRDQEVLREIDRAEKNASMIRGALAYSGLSTAIASNLPTLAFQLSQFEPQLLSEALSGTEKIRVCRIAEIIQYRILDDPPSLAFWEKLLAPYEKACGP